MDQHSHAKVAVTPTTQSVIAQLAAALVERDRLLAQCEGFRNDLERLRRELELRDSALDATSAHFLIADVRRRASREAA